MNIHPIKNNKDYEATLKRIATLMDINKKSEEMDELEILSILVEKFEYL